MKMFEGQIYTPPPVARQWTWYYYAAQTQRLGLRLGIVAGTNSRAMSIDMALSTCCDVRSNAY